MRGEAGSKLLGSAETKRWPQGVCELSPGHQRMRESEQTGGFFLLCLQQMCARGQSISGTSLPRKRGERGLWRQLSLTGHCGRCLMSVTVFNPHSSLSSWAFFSHRAEKDFFGPWSLSPGPQLHCVSPIQPSLRPVSVRH